METVTGQVEHITFSNEENGFTIARVRTEDEPEGITVLGPLMNPQPGTVLEMRGEWTVHPRFGEQFKVTSWQTKVPTTAAGIRAYLGSGAVDGIGEVMAARIVDMFGTDAMEIIDRDPDRLTEVPGIGASRKRKILDAWESQKESRAVMLFLHGHGLTANQAAKIERRYGRRAMKVLEENPYRLAGDIRGIGFKIADRIAEAVGFPRDSVRRVEAGVVYCLERARDQGHVCLPKASLTARAVELLGVEADVVTGTVDGLERKGRIVVDESFPDGPVYMPELYAEEAEVADRLLGVSSATVRPTVRADTGGYLGLQGGQSRGRTVRDGSAAAGNEASADRVGDVADRPVCDAEIRKLEQRMDITLAEEQRSAVKAAFESRVVVITGGPGTGKTTVIRFLGEVAHVREMVVRRAAPTGRAARRMKEATGFSAATIHRLLEVDAQKGRFKRDEYHPLDCDLLIVDEVSMVDTSLMAALLRAVPQHARLVLVGDSDQLPSVGPGNVLGDVLGSGAVPLIRLNHIFRQARESRIVVNAHRIHDGLMPEQSNDPAGDFFFIRQSDPGRIVDTINELVCARIPDRFGLDPIADIQVLTPMHKGPLGTANLNAVLQTALNPGREPLQRGSRSYAYGDKVMQIRNNYEKLVFNGDIGYIRSIDTEAKSVLVEFDERAVTYDYLDLDELVPAYAVSVHKSQGSEYPAVVMPVHTQHYVLLQRNLIYTSVTRARRLMVLVGSERALRIGIRNAARAERHTHLADRLRRGVRADAGQRGNAMTRSC